MAKRELLRYNCIKPGLQIGEDIVDVLSTDGKTDRALADARLCQLLGGHLCMCCIVRMDHEALHVCNVFSSENSFRPSMNL